MNLLKAVILTLTPAVFGLVCFYESIAHFPLEHLYTLVYKQLLYINCYCILFSLVLNYWLVRKVTKQAKRIEKLETVSWMYF
jgi:predicted membrane chloride channel (bestrophin family)